MAEESNNPTTEQSDWNGNRPEGLSDKFKSVDALAKSYGELEKRFGGFTGAPENYEFGEGVNAKDPRINGLIELARESNMNNDTLNRIIDLDRKSSEERVKAYREEQLKLLGDNAQDRINKLSDWSKNNVPAELQDTFKDIATNAKAVELLEAMMNNSKPQAPVDDLTPQNTGITKEELDKMQFELDEHGNRRISVDASFREKFNEMYRQYKGQ